jgi:hypothetical protein
MGPDPVIGRALLQGGRLVDEPSAPADRHPDDGGTGARERAVDARERAADVRDAALDAREESIRAREDEGAERRGQTQGILDRADERDSQAADRDARADDRDHEASLRSFLHDEDFAPGVEARQAAGMDRADSKDDRTSAAGDRSRLTGADRTAAEAAEG